MGYTVVSNDILNYNISEGAFKLYFILESMCFGNKTNCFPSQAFLATKMKRSVRSIQRYLNELTLNGLIEKKRRGSISNIYKVLLKKTTAIINTVLDKVAAHNKNTNSKKAYPKSKVSTKNLKAPNWNLEERGYNFDNLEDMLLGFKSYNESELYK